MPGVPVEHWQHSLETAAAVCRDLSDETGGRTGKRHVTFLSRPSPVTVHLHLHQDTTHAAPAVCILLCQYLCRNTRRTLTPLARRLPCLGESLLMRLEARAGKRHVTYLLRPSPVTIHFHLHQDTPNRGWLPPFVCACPNDTP